MRPEITGQTKGVEVVVKNIGNKEATDFYVDFFLSRDQQLSKGQPRYFPPLREDVFIREGRKHIRLLGPGKSISIPAPSPIKTNRRPNLQDYFLGSVVDHSNSVKEMIENNNIAWLKYKDLFLYEANINSTGQLGVMHPASIGQMCLTISGSGFGPTFTNKNVYLGSHALAIQDLESTSTGVQAVITPNITFGEIYNVYYAENGVRISNIKQHLLKVYIETCGRLDGMNIELEGPAGCTVKIWGAYYGSMQGSYVVHFGPTIATVTNWTNGIVDIVCPNLPPGHYQIYFEKNGQDVTMAHGGFTIQ
ncbi:CARDB domain-containing protein [Acidobacteriota bacterium]